MATDWTKVGNDLKNTGVTVDQVQSGDTSGLDDLGFSQSLPKGHAGPRVQFLSEKKVAQRNANLMRGAFGRLGAGLDLLQSYRPGGAAALSSGMFQQQANVLANSRTQAPDLMYFTRGAIAHRARKASKRAGQMNLLAGAIQAAGTALGGAAGGAAAGALTSAAGMTGQPAQPGAPDPYGQQGAPPPAVGGAVGGAQEAGPAQAAGAVEPGTGGTPGAPGLETLLRGVPGNDPLGDPNQYQDPVGPKTQAGVGQAQLDPGGGGGAAGGPQPAQGAMGMDGGGGGSMLQSGLVGPMSMVQQLSSSMGPEVAANMVGMAKADDSSHYDNVQFYDGFEAGLDQMMVRVFSRTG